jgi:hypothetical protein
MNTSPCVKIIYMCDSINWFNTATFMCLSKDLDFYQHAVVLFVFDILRWEVIVRFVDIYFLKQNANPKLLWIRLISLLPIFLELMKYEVFMKRKLK